MYLKNHKGFTLLELILVILILSIVMAIVIPSFQRPLAYYKLYTAGRQMVADIREWQQRALTEEQSYKIKFDTKNNKYYITKGIYTINSIQLPTSINLYSTNFGNNEFIIDISGNPQNGFGGTVIIQNDYNKRLFIIVAKTGRVRMDDKPPQ